MKLLTPRSSNNGGADPNSGGGVDIKIALAVIFVTFIVMAFCLTTCMWCTRTIRQGIIERRVRALEGQIIAAHWDPRSREIRLLQMPSLYEFWIQDYRGNGEWRSMHPLAVEQRASQLDEASKNNKKQSIGRYELSLMIRMPSGYVDDAPYSHKDLVIGTYYSQERKL
ncbi:hypothetical protein CPB86DRAFT_627689 [Serendipita vermifera]|nr:hypothetical protein CPB86DRAFT_627689 [Serendipita vermifera]